MYTIAISVLLLCPLRVGGVSLGRFPIDLNLPFGNMLNLPPLDGSSAGGQAAAQINLPFSDMALPMQGLFDGLTGGLDNLGQDLASRPVVQLNGPNGTTFSETAGGGDPASRAAGGNSGGPMGVINLPLSKFHLPLSSISQKPKQLPSQAKLQLDQTQKRRKPTRANFAGNIQGNLATAHEAAGATAVAGLPLTNKLSTQYDVLNFPLNVVSMPLSDVMAQAERALGLGGAGPPAVNVSPLDRASALPTVDNRAATAHPSGVAHIPTQVAAAQHSGGIVDLNSFSQPYSFLNTPLSYFNLPLSFVNLPFGSTNLPFAHLNLPLAFVNPSLTDLLQTVGVPGAGSVHRAAEQLDLTAILQETLPQMDSETDAKSEAKIAQVSPLDHPLGELDLKLDELPIIDSGVAETSVQTSPEAGMDAADANKDTPAEAAQPTPSSAEVEAMKESWDGWVEQVQSLPSVEVAQPAASPKQGMEQANDLIRSIAGVAAPGSSDVGPDVGAGFDQMLRSVVPGIPEMGGLIGTPFSLFTTPFSVFNTPFGFIDLPMGFMNLPLSHFNLPLSSLTMPFAGLNLPFDEIAAPAFDQPPAEFTVEAADLPPSLLEVLNPQNPLTSYLNLPLSEMNLPIAVLDMPFALFDMPFGFFNLPLSHLNNPLTHLHLPFELTNLPFDELLLPFEGLVDYAAPATGHGGGGHAPAPAHGGASAHG